ncbi:DNA primase [Planococcus salinus]|uniref:DNA primase n=1 Tax=Planococcus salinus TaxID=1848460 RepID=A0A3M8P4M7_9BACL|nr:DNA primase [Planococcus salinus]RNF38351.1 DNA primase [Planococcus salinus]
MLNNKWIKAGSAALLSMVVLAGCGEEEEPVIEEDLEVVPEEEQNTDTESDLDLEQDDTNPEEDLETDMNPDVETDEDSEGN